MLNSISIKGIGSGVPIIDTQANDRLKGLPATGLTRWHHLGGELGLIELDARIEPILGRDNGYQRKQFQPYYESSHAAIIKTGLRQLITQARGAAINKELRVEIRDSKVLIAANEGLAVVREALRPSYETFRERVSYFQKVYDTALTPTGDAMALELRAREVRDGLRRLPRGEAGLALMRAAQAGSIDAVYAAAHDPLGTEIVPVEVLQQAQHVVLDATGLGWVWKNLQDELDLLPEWAGRCDQLEMLLVSTLGAPPFSVKLSRPEGQSFYNLAVAHIEALNGNKAISTALAA